MFRWRIHRNRYSAQLADPYFLDREQVQRRAAEITDPKTGAGRVMKERGWTFLDARLEAIPVQAAHHRSLELAGNGLSDGAWRAALHILRANSIWQSSSLISSELSSGNGATNERYRGLSRSHEGPF